MLQFFLLLLFWWGRRLLKMLGCHYHHDYDYLQILERHVMSYIITYYLPSGLFVVVSWISFLIPPDIVPGQLFLSSSSSSSVLFLPSLIQQYWHYCIKVKDKIILRKINLTLETSCPLYETRDLFSFLIDGFPKFLKSDCLFICSHLPSSNCLKLPMPFLASVQWGKKIRRWIWLRHKKRSKLPKAMDVWSKYFSSI